MQKRKPKILRVGTNFNNFKMKNSVKSKKNFIQSVFDYFKKKESKVSEKKK